MKGLIFTYALTYGGALASLIRPYTGLLIYVCFAIIKPESMWYWSVPQGHYSRIVAIALLAGWALHGFGKWRLGKAWPSIGCLIGFWLWAGVSAVHSGWTPVSVLFLEDTAKIVLPVVVGITLIQSVEQLKQLAWVIVLSQGYVGFELNVAYYQGFNRIQQVGFAGMDNNSVAIAMVAGTGLAFFLALSAAKWWQKGIAFVAAACMAHSVLFAFSRGGMLALIITGLVSFFLIRPQPKHFVALVLAILLGLRLAGPEVRERFFTTFAAPEERDTSAQSRLDLWEDCWDAMKSRPMFGIGPNLWPLVADEYGWPKGKEAHSLWMQTGAELGFPGLLMLLGFYGLCAVRLFPLARRRDFPGDLWLQDAARMVIASLAGFAVAAQFVSLEGLEIPYYAALVGAGALKITSYGLEGRSSPPVILAPRETGTFLVNRS